MGCTAVVGTLLLTGCFRDARALIDVVGKCYGHGARTSSSFSAAQWRYFSSKSDNVDAEVAAIVFDGPHHDARWKVQEAFSILARQGNAWKRLSHLVEMAIGINNSGHPRDHRGRTIADVGTDHGLLAMGLALSGQFQSVIGVDVSKQALNGAFALLEQVQSHQSELREASLAFQTPVEFRYGDGLKALKEGEADIVCIAGMGVNTMIDILGLGLHHTIMSSELDRIRCTDLILQPTNSKPRNLMLLYQTLQQSGWELRHEQIEKLSSRWYLTCHFVTRHDNAESRVVSDDAINVPGLILDTQPNTSDTMQQAWDDYCRHHLEWIRRDEQYGKVCPLEARWLKRFGNCNDRQ